MIAAIASLLGLVIALIVSMLSRVNVGIVAVTIAWIVGVYVAGMKADAVLAGFPAGLFLTLAGVTLLFAIADANGSLAATARRAFRMARGSALLLPWAFFLLGFAMSASGPGAVPGVALIIPLAMALGLASGLPPLLTALMVANGANSGNLSPLSAVGVIANSRMSSAGIAGHEWKVMAANFLAHVAVAAVAYGVYLARGRATGAVASVDAAPASFTRSQRLTLAVIATWIFAVVAFKLHVGLSAFGASLLLVALRACDDAQVMAKMPWGIILMVCGMGTLVALLESSGGMELFTQGIAKVATPRTLNGTIAFVTGVISSYSSTSGVVLPAFLPTSATLVQSVGGGDPLAVALSINVGSSLVDVSPLSTIGALCVAAVSDPAVARKLFYQLLVWGLLMTVVGAVLCQLFAGALAAWGP